jgi:hypothetical protein
LSAEQTERVFVKILQFFALMLGGVVLVPAGAHLFALPNKIHLAQMDYFIVQNIYRGWALFGIVLIGNVLVLAALAVMQRARTAPLVLVLISLVSQIAGLAIFFALVYPANVATNNWTEIPANWAALRWNWEIGHAVNACIAFAGFGALSLSVLLTRDIAP